MCVLGSPNAERVTRVKPPIMGGSERVNDPAPVPGTTSAHKAVVASSVGTEGDR